MNVSSHPGLILRLSRLAVSIVLLTITQSFQVNATTVNSTTDWPRNTFNSNTEIFPAAWILNGRVLNENDAPIGGVSITVKGTNRGTTTNSEGRFSLEMISENDSVVVSFVGYLPYTFVAGTQREVTIKLLPDATGQNLSELVVTAYGRQKKVSVTAAISTVQTEELRRSSAASLATSLAGKLSGLVSTQASGGQPGRDDALLYLRGAATTNGQQPLIMIDGVPRDNIRTLDPNEVESVSILKDASATAVFGVRGANGVILITTRRGSPGKTQLQINAEQTYNSFTREPARLHSADYMRLRNEAARNDGIKNPPFPANIIAKYENPLDGLNPNDPDYQKQAALRNYIYPDHYYYREMVKQYSPQTRVNINASGGTNRLNYFLNAVYLHQGGNFNVQPQSLLGYDASSWLDRYNFRSNLDYKITKNLIASLNIGSYLEKVNMPAAWLYGNDTHWMVIDWLYHATTILPITPGPMTIPGYGVPAGQIVDPNYIDRSAFEIMNRFGYRREVRSNLNTSFELKWNLNRVTKGLTARGMVSYDSRSTTATSANKSERLYVANVDYNTNSLNYTIKRPNESLLSIVGGADSRYNINLQAALNYQREFGKHDVGGMILAQRDNWESTGGEIPYNVVGVAGRVTYGYDTRYLAEFNMGYNGSEQFAPTKRFGFFPAYSVGWVISNENFMKGINNVISTLKLRASYGVVGNDRIGSNRFLYLDNITMGGGPLPSLGLGAGVNEGLLGNPALSWELSKKKNFGIDLGLFRQLTLAFDYFIENRSQILITRGSVPVLQGVPLGNLPKANMGKVDNSGWELEAKYVKTFSNGLRINIMGNLGVNKNKVVFLDEPIRDSTYAYRYRSTGFPLGQQWGYKIDYSNGNGYFNSQQELDEYLSRIKYGFGDPRVGDFKYLDLNNDGVINDKDIAPVKYTTIPGVTYGITLNLEFKGFDFTTFVQGLGRYSFRYGNDQGQYENIKLGTYFPFHLKAWTPERYAAGEEITYPALSTRSTTNHTANDFWIMNHAFTRLKTVELGYRLPSQWVNRLRLKSTRLYARADNYFVWTHMPITHLDPENRGSIDYPVTKSLNVGLNITF